MSNKGKTFTHADLPRVTQQRIANKQVNKAELEHIDAVLKRHTERNRIVATMDDGTPLIAEEVTERAMREHARLSDGSIDPRAISLVRMLVDSDPTTRDRVLLAFDKKGALKLPFKKV